MNEKDFIYEAELEDKIKNTFIKKYGIKEEKIFEYLTIRYSLLNNIKLIKKIDEKEFIHFVVSELLIPINLNKFEYKDTQVSLFGSYSQSIENILTNIKFDAEKKNYLNIAGNNVKIETYIQEILDTIILKATKNTQKYKKEKMYNEIVLFKKILELNETYKVHNNQNIKIDGIQYSEEFEFIRTEEEKLASIYEAFKNVGNSIVEINESQLEKYISANLNKVEEGLKLVATQYKINGGVIDILAKDKNDNLVVIEVKIASDERIIWQTIYYPMQLKKARKIETVRTITISPKYSKQILEPLKTLNTDIYKAHITSENNKIVNVEFKLLKKAKK